MRDLLLAGRGERLDLPAYHADLARAAGTANGPVLRLERGQVFREPDNPSWVAFEAGRWEDALRLAARPDPAADDILARLRRQGSELRRLRIVEFPPTAYLHWQLCVLRHRVAAGERVRVLNADTRTTAEADQGSLPELVTVGDEVVYELLYDPTGTPVGAQRITDPQLVTRCRDHFTGLYQEAEEFGRFFERRVAPLPPPELV
ncbi:MAG TPA: hypothetical protein VGD43_20320 [Micromonospora sp.]